MLEPPVGSGWNPVGFLAGPWGIWMV